MESQLDYWSARALLAWQVELGATEALCDLPVNRYELEEVSSATVRPAEQAEAVRPAKVDPVEQARKLARAAPDLEALRAALDGFSHCDLKHGARNLVFAEGQPGARVMIIGEAPGRDEDLQGRPFAGAAAALLGRMLAAIELQAERDVYITTVLPWRPPQNRDPLPGELMMLLPFLERHVALARPDVVVLMGNVACQAALGRRGMSRLRGTWVQAWGKPALPMLSPHDLLRKPQAKRQAWEDLLALKARLATLT